ncbi:MAG: 3'(2'),5'-bisphosphate nucleotidase, partial [Bacteroidetes bacterium]
IAVEAGERILEVYHSPAHAEVWSKADASPLTAADLAAHRHICERLEALAPEIPVISEEARALSWAERSGWRRCFLVDPLDGTKEFLKRNGEFTVNIALVEEGEPVLGVVYAPALKELYWGGREEGAWKEVGGERRRLAVGEWEWGRPGMRVVCSRSHLNPETEACLAALPEPELLSRGSSLKFLMLAQGAAEFYPRLAPTMEWDTAAAQAVLEAAGGCVLEWERAQPLRYNKPELRNPFFAAFACRAEKAAPLLEALKRP